MANIKTTKSAQISSYKEYTFYMGFYIPCYFSGIKHRTGPIFLHVAIIVKNYDLLSFILDPEFAKEVIIIIEK